jgi:L-malate glycosyltransferase
MSDVGDVEDMIKNTLYLLDNDARLNKFKKQAKERAYDFDLGKILPMYEQLYQDVLNLVQL